MSSPVEDAADRLIGPEAAADRRRVAHEQKKFHDELAELIEMCGAQAHHKDRMRRLLAQLVTRSTMERELLQARIVKLVGPR